MSAGGGGEHITGHVEQSLMQKRALEGSSTLSSNVTLANKAITMKEALNHENRLFVMNPEKLM